MKEGWELKKLGEVCQFDKLKNGKDNLPYVGLEHIESNTGKFIGTMDSVQVKSSTFYFNDKHLLYGRLRPYLNKVLIPNFEGHCSTEIFPIKVSDVILREFLFLWFTSEKTVEMINSTCTGARMPRANMKEVINFQIPIPPLSEQKQIVAILDKTFEAIDQAKANIEKNIENAKELFQSKLNEIFSQNCEGWEEHRLKDITTKIGSGATPKGGQTSYKESGISLIRSMNVHDAGFVNDKLAFIDKSQAEKLNYVTIKENDVLLNITGASVARCCIAPKAYLPARVNQHVSIIRLMEGIMDKNFLHYSLISQENKKRLLGIGEQGSTRQAITKAQIENFVVKFPSNINEQIRIVERLNFVRKDSSLVVENYQKKLNNLEELKKSLLQKAFAGELT